MKSAKVVSFSAVLCLVALNAHLTSAIRNPKMKVDPQKFLKLNSTVKYQGPNDFPWDTFCVDYNVPDGEFFPHPDSCNWYFLCWDGVLVVGECEDGEYFDPNYGYCDLEENYECVLGLFPEWIGNDCPSSGRLVLPSLYCDSFIICVDGWAFEFQCRPGQHWNANREYCDDPRNAGCDGETQFPQEFPDCPATFVGNVPHPDNCNQYIHCNNGNRFIQRCPHLFNFDIVTARCTVITQANCIDEYRGRRRN